MNSSRPAVNANKNDIPCGKFGFDLLKSILSGFKDVVVELKLLSQLWKVFFEQVEGIGALPNVEKLIEPEFSRILVEPFVREISVPVFLKQGFPRFSQILPHFTNCVNLELAPVEHFCNLCNLGLQQFRPHSKVLAEILKEDWLMMIKTA